LGVYTVQQLLAVDRIRFRYLRGVGDRIRKEIRERAKRLAQLRPDLVPGSTAEDRQGWASIDRLVEQLLPRRPAGVEPTEDRVLAEYLGLEPFDTPVAWRNPGDVARSAGVSRSAVAEALDRARERWHKSREINEVRAELDRLLRDDGGVASADELASKLLAARGSVEVDEALRARLCLAVLRAAVELEASVTEPRFAAYMETTPILIAANPELADYARRLGREADRLAAEDPLPGPGRAEEQLERLPTPENGTPLPNGRLLRLAAAVSAGAAASARLELYPRGMAAETALRLSLGTLAGPQKLTEDGASRARARPFPGSGAVAAAARARCFARTSGRGTRLARRRLLSAHLAGLRDRNGRLHTLRHPGARPGGHAGPPRRPGARREALARREDRRVSRLDRRAATQPRRGSRTAAPLSAGRRQPRTADAAGDAGRGRGRRVPWPKVLAADAMAHNSRDFQNLLRHASRAAPRARDHVLGLREPALLTRAGLLARYQLMDMLSAFAQGSGTRDGPPSLWLLLPQPDPGMPRVNGTVLPVISSANWARLTEAWIANAHRAGSGTRSAA
jgi:hypothetical protein